MLLLDFISNLYQIKLLVRSALFQLSVVESITLTAPFPSHDAAKSLADLSAMIHAAWLLRSALSGSPQEQNMSRPSRVKHFCILAP